MLKIAHALHCNSRDGGPCNCDGDPQAMLWGSAKRRFGPDPENREPEPEWQIPPIETRPRQPFFTIRRSPMSYSFAITGTSKADASAKVAAEFDKVVVNQPSHAADKEAAVAAANAFITLLREPGDSEQISVNMYGSLGWEGTYESPKAFLSGNVSVSASIAAKSKILDPQYVGLCV